MGSYDSTGVRWGPSVHAIDLGQFHPMDCGQGSGTGDFTLARLPFCCSHQNWQLYHVMFPLKYENLSVVTRPH